MNDAEKQGLSPGADDLPEVDGFGREDVKRYREAINAAAAAGRQIAKDFGGLGRRERFALAGTFRRQLIPPGSPGRKRSEQITAAHADWKLGLRGPSLYRRHIDGWDRHGRWRRDAEARRLMDAIRNRERRDRKRFSKHVAEHRPISDPH